MSSSPSDRCLSVQLKLALLLASTALALYATNLLLLVCMNATMMALILCFSDSFREISSVVKRLAMGLPVLLLIYVASAWTGSSTFSGAVYSGSLGAAVFLLKIHYVLWANLYLARTTEPRHIVLALRKIRVPRELCLMITVILRFFPVMFDEARAVFQAQYARGFELRHILNPANWLPLAVPLVVNVMKKSNDLAIVIELDGRL
jgi:energy-coupling factor transporter transmembrane protein EcfT